MHKVISAGWLVVLLGAGLASALDVPHVAIGQPIGAFSVLDAGGEKRTFAAEQGSVTVVAFTSTRCPMSNAFNSRLNDLYTEFGKRVRFVVVDSNVNESLEEVRRHAVNMGYDFPVFKDSDESVANLFGALSTPDTFVVDRSGRLQYHGYIEDAPNPARSTKRALRFAIEAALQNQPAPFPETHSLGCSIRRLR